MQFLLDRFAETPTADAFIDSGRHVTYGEVLQLISRSEGMLEEAGVPRGAVVMVVADYSPEVFCFLMALAQRACVAVPITPDSVVERQTVLQLSHAGWIAEFDDACRSPTLSSTGRKPDSALLTTFLARGRPGMILFSSGSTGTPKAILHDLEVVASKFRKRGAPIVSIAFLMLDHFGGINTILAITSGLGTVVTVEDRSVAGICKAIARHRVEVLPTTPSFLSLLVRSDLAGTYDLGSLKRITYGTEVMPQATLDRLRQLFPTVQLQQTYGLSELGVLRSKSRPDGSLWVRIGGDGFQTRVVDGILWIKSDYAMVGYLNAPSPFDAEGWFNTQDKVEVDGEWFRILGRTTDLINVGGQKVYPAEIEDVVLNVENVVDVSVYGEKHALLGNMVVAKVVLAQPEPLEALKQRIRRECLAKLTPYKVPTKVVIAEQGLYSNRMKKLRKATGTPPSTPEEAGIVDNPAPKGSRRRDGPLVSVVMPSYNHERYIIKALQSVADSTYENLELLVVDDASRDRTFELASDWARANDGRFRRVEVRRHEVNRGICATLNELVSAARGDYIAPLASDDLLIAGGIEAQVACAIEKKVEFVFADASLVDEEDVPIAASAVTYFGRTTEALARPARFVVDVLLNWEAPWTRIFASSRLFREVGGFDESLQFEDRDFVVRAMAYGSFAFLPESVYCYRLRRTNRPTPGLDHTRTNVDFLRSEWKNYARARGLVRLLLGLNVLAGRIRFDGQGQPRKNLMWPLFAGLRLGLSWLHRVTMRSGGPKP